MPLSNYDVDDFTHNSVTHRVYRKGTGPGVVVMAEIPGITPKVIEFADAVVARGMSVAMPSLFGIDGAEPTTPRTIRTFGTVCVAKEFAAFAIKRDRPVTDWLRALASDLHRRAGGVGVGAVGMCFTGGFGLAMMAEESVVAPVLSQPSVPLVGPKARRDLGMSDETLEIVKSRVDGGCAVLGLRFTGDKLVPSERFDELRAQLGDGFLAVEIPSPDPKWDIASKAHSVITEEVDHERDDHPATLAFNQVLDFLAERLMV
jgi:dienelactone hydrolase